jgi:hypothetical protein
MTKIRASIFALATQIAFALDLGPLVGQGRDVYYDKWFPEVCAIVYGSPILPTPLNVAYGFDAADAAEACAVAAMECRANLDLGAATNSVPCVLVYNVLVSTGCQESWPPSISFNYWESHGAEMYADNTAASIECFNNDCTSVDSYVEALNSKNLAYFGDISNALRYKLRVCAANQTLTALTAEMTTAYHTIFNAAWPSITVPGLGAVPFDLECFKINSIPYSISELGVTECMQVFGPLAHWGVPTAPPPTCRHVQTQYQSTCCGKDLDNTPLVL